MTPHVFRSTVGRTLCAALCTLALSSCGHSPTAPMGRLVVHISENAAGPAAGKKVEVVGTSQARLTNADGLAFFVLPAGSQVVRAYDLGTPGPGSPYVDQSVEIEPASTSRVEFNDCTMCR